jgi:hypothetical protein
MTANSKWPPKEDFMEDFSLNRNGEFIQVSFIKAR